jgi:hypothetical protein
VSTRTHDDFVALDDRPLGLHLARDGKRLLVTLPWAVCVVHGSTREVERTIPVPSAAPSVHDHGDDGTLWIGGQHLHRANLRTGTITKVGSRLGGFVDHVGFLRPSLLCGVGSHGEILWEPEGETFVHRRRTSERHVSGCLLSDDGRAIFADGSTCAWIIDPDHPTGYAMLRLPHTQPSAPSHVIDVIGRTSEGRCILAARDGTVGWTHRTLRMERDVLPPPAECSEPLCATGDSTFVYVLRGGGLLQRFRLHPDAPVPEGETVPPAAESVRLGRAPTCVVAGTDACLWLGGPTADGQLGRLWSVDPGTLSWSPIPLRSRGAPPPDADPAAPREEARAPTFVAVRSRIEGTPLSELRVDDVLGCDGFFVTTSTGSLLERPVTRATLEKILPGDALLLPAMVRFEEGTARPALLLLPGNPSGGTAPEPEWLVWGDAPRGWMPLRTPEIREQKWERRGVFPLQVALPAAHPDGLAGHGSVPRRWVDPELFAALTRECRKLLKVLW